jgi:hypothetical protein
MCPDEQRSDGMATVFGSQFLSNSFYFQRYLSLRWVPGLAVKLLKPFENLSFFELSNLKPG